MRGHPDPWTRQVEIEESRRVQAAADRAEVVGKRSILVVTLADRTAQDAMSLALESPRDARGTGDEGSGVTLPCALPYPRRRHARLTEALSLYVKALSMLQGALPGVLVECEGASTDGLAPWNPLGLQDEQHQQNKNMKERLDHSAPPPLSPSNALLSQRSALATKASWLKELFSQTLQRAEHCREQVAAAAVAAASAGPCPVLPSSSSTDNVAGPCTPWTTLGSDGGGSGMVPPADPAAAAVYRRAVEHGQEAAVCYLLGRSDAAIVHYVRACALLQLLALEPEMACAGVREEGMDREGGTGGGEAGGGRWGGLRGEESLPKQPQAPTAGGWREKLLLMADGYARRVELISGGGEGKRIDEGVVQGQAGERVGGEGVGGGGVASAPVGFGYST